MSALEQHLHRNPQTRHTALHDPQLAADLNRLRMMLEHLDAAMDAETVPADVRDRVTARVVSGCLGTDAERAALAARAAETRGLLLSTPVRWPSGG